MIALIAAASVFGLATSAGLVALMLRWARRRHLLDHPNERSLHEHPTPRGGGIGIVLPVSVALILTGWGTPAGAPAVWLAMLGLILGVVGFLDDLRDVSAALRLVIQTAAAVLFVTVVGKWSVLSFPGLADLDFGYAAAPLTVVFLVWVCNAYNFMDGIDGIAGLQGLIAGLAWLAIGCWLDDALLTVGGAVIACSCLGFLYFNWSPASIFMGDVGTGFLGFVLGGLAVYASTVLPPAATAGVIALWPFLFDTGFTIVRRAARRENLLRAHRSHLYQRLVLSGFSHRAVTLAYGGLAGLGAAAGLVALMSGAWPLIWLTVPILAAAAWLAVVRRERSSSR